MRPSDLAGDVGGWLLSPVTSAIAAVRRSRMFHPDGVVLMATVEPDGDSTQLAQLAQKLEGYALVRLSSAWWKGNREWPDDLGLAVRFRKTDEVSPEAAEGDQDLLFATIRSPWTTVLAVLSTKIHDFLANDYYAVSPFQVEGVGRVKWRLVSSRPETHGHSRVERLLNAVRSTGAVFTLQAKLSGQPYRNVAKLRLIQPVEIDQRRLRFDPFRDARGIVPVGFVQMLRRGAYAGSQKTRSHVQQTEQSAL
ncbi:MAG: hypothetical protein ACJ790_06185 [Myxococcaceae bacterium]